MRNLKHKWALLTLSVCLVGSIGFANPDSRAQEISRDFTAVAKKAIPAVVAIKVKSQKKKSSSFFDSSSDDLNELFNDDFFQRFFRKRGEEGESPQQSVTGAASGFIISPEGYVLTNSHVVREASEIEVTLNDAREYSAKVIGSDPNTDIAILKIDAKDLPSIELGDSNKLEIGEWVVAIGNPMGLQASLTVGVVSALGRNNLDIANVEDFIQTDAAINRGNSGGPLLNLDGQVIGMNTAIVANMAMGNMGLGFAIPSNMIKPVMDQIIKTGSVTRGFIGVTLQTIDKDLAQAFNVEQNGGALISAISKDSPAEKAGLKQGDIIRSYNSHKVNNIATLRNAISLMSPGASINLSVLREGKTLEIPVQIGEYPVSKPEAVAMSGSKLGFEVQDLTPEIAKTLGITDEQGVVVSKVNPGSPAAWVGLKKGTLIMAVNKKQIENVKDFKSVLDGIEADKPIIFLVKQGEAIRFLSLRIGQ